MGIWGFARKYLVPSLVGGIAVLISAWGFLGDALSLWTAGIKPVYLQMSGVGLFFTATVAVLYRQHQAIEGLRVADGGGSGSDNTIIQGATIVATVTGATVDKIKGAVHFGQIAGGPHFDEKADFEFRGLHLRMVNAAMVNRAAGAQTLVGVQCQIIAKGATWGP